MLRILRIAYNSMGDICNVLYQCNIIYFCNVPAARRTGSLEQAVV